MGFVEAIPDTVAEAETLCTESVSNRVPLKLPVVVGLNWTTWVQEPPGRTVVPQLPPATRVKPVPTMEKLTLRVVPPVLDKVKVVTGGGVGLMGTLL